MTDLLRVTAEALAMPFQEPDVNDYNDARAVLAVVLPAVAELLRAQAEAARVAVGGRHPGIAVQTHAAALRYAADAVLALLPKEASKQRGYEAHVAPVAWPEEYLPSQPMDPWPVAKDRTGDVR